MKFIARELKKRRKNEKIKRFSSINWPIKKQEIDLVFREFNHLFSDSKINFDITTTLNSDFSNKFYVGYDVIQIGFPFRWTGNQVVTEGDEQVTMDHKSEHGPTLVISTSELGIINVMLMPAKNDDKKIEVESLLLFTTSNPNDLTRDKVEKFLHQFVVFQRVDSLLELASFNEKFYIKWLYFFDARKRQKTQSILFNITNHWAAVLLSALAAWFIAKNT
jgi:hypothetical protein